MTERVSTERLRELRKYAGDSVLSSVRVTDRAEEMAFNDIADALAELIEVRGRLSNLRAYLMGWDGNEPDDSVRMVCASIEGILGGQR